MKFVERKTPSVVSIHTENRFSVTCQNKMNFTRFSQFSNEFSFCCNPFVIDHIVKHLYKQYMYFQDAHFSFKFIILFSCILKTGIYFHRCYFFSCILKRRILFSRISKRWRAVYIVATAGCLKPVRKFYKQSDLQQSSLTQLLS